MECSLGLRLLCAGLEGGGALQLLRMDIPELLPGPHTTDPILASHWPGRGRGKGQAGTGLREGAGISFAGIPQRQGKGLLDTESGEKGVLSLGALSQKLFDYGMFTGPGKPVPSGLEGVCMTRLDIVRGWLFTVH